MPTIMSTLSWALGVQWVVNIEARTIEDNVFPENRIIAAHKGSSQFRFQESLCFRSILSNHLP